MPDLIPSVADSRFTVLAVRKSSPEPLLQLNLPWERLMEDIVIPFEAGDMFFVDGAPVKSSDLDRIKILVNGPDFEPFLNRLLWQIRCGDVRLDGKQFALAVHALILENCTDITSQVISAFKTVVKPKLTDRLPDRRVLFDAAIQLVIAGTRAWSGHHETA